MNQVKVRIESLYEWRKLECLQRSDQEIHRNKHAADFQRPGAFMNALSAGQDLLAAGLLATVTAFMIRQCLNRNSGRPSFGKSRLFFTRYGDAQASCG
jgi:hypothetical protein